MFFIHKKYKKREEGRIENLETLQLEEHNNHNEKETHRVAFSKNILQIEPLQEFFFNNFFFINIKLQLSKLKIFLNKCFEKKKKEEEEILI